MTREFIILPSFQVKWNELGFNDEDMIRLETELINNPKIGPVIRKTGGVRKMRFAFENRGKSGSVRIIYVDFELYEKLYFIDVFQKSCKENLTNEERNNMSKIVNLIELSLKEEKNERNV